MEIEMLNKVIYFFSFVFIKEKGDSQANIQVKLTGTCKLMKLDIRQVYIIRVYRLRVDVNNFYAST